MVRSLLAVAALCLAGVVAAGCASGSTGRVATCALGATWTMAKPCLPGPHAARITGAVPARPPTPVAREASAGSAPPSTTGRSGYRPVSGPGGLTVFIPDRWVLSDSPAAANQQANDPAELDVFARFGASAAPDVGLLSEIQAGEQTNPNVRNSYRRVLLEALTFQGEPAVDWEFTFVKNGTTRHAKGRYWRIRNTEYVIYVSGPDQTWDALRPVFDYMAETVIIH